MDKNTITGLVLIGILLVGFSFETSKRGTDSCAKEILRFYCRSTTARGSAESENGSCTG